MGHLLKLTYLLDTPLDSFVGVRSSRPFFIIVDLFLPLICFFAIRKKYICNILLKTNSTLEPNLRGHKRLLRCYLCEGTTQTEGIATLCNFLQQLELGETAVARMSKQKFLVCVNSLKEVPHWAVFFNSLL